MKKDEQELAAEYARKAHLAAQTTRCVAEYFIGEIASPAADRVVNRTIRLLRAMPPVLVEGLGPRNFWEELCIQIQRDDVFFYESNCDRARPLLEEEVARLTDLERTALWLTTYEGEIYLDEPLGSVCVPKSLPISARDVAKHLVIQLRDEAMNYENATIRAMTGRY